MAIPDGRKEKEPFATHISANSGLAYTELMCYASKLDYTNNSFNGNVVDFIVPKYFISDNKNAFYTLIRTAMDMGLFQT